MTKVGKGTLDPERVKAKLRADFDYLSTLASDCRRVSFVQLEEWQSIAILIQQEQRPA
jgi:hypothetical protein